MSASVGGRTVLITGAARGIGAAVAQVVAERGAHVCLVGLEPELLSSVTTSLPGSGHRWYEADVRDQAALSAAVDAAVESTGRLDVVVANAGVAPLGTVAVTDVEALVRTIDVNLNGVIRTAKAALPALRASRGYALLVSSAAAFTALPGMAAYCASKAGVEQFGNVLRLENAHVGVQVGTAHPIWIDTDLVQGMRSDLPSFREALAKLPWPLGQMISARRCAEALVRGIERRARRVYVPRSIGGVQALRTLFSSGIAEAAITRRGHGQVERMEAEVRAIGRAFGEHSAVESRDGVA